MKFKPDSQADAIYIYLSEKPYAYGKDLDDERRIDYASDNTPIGVELLCVSDGVNLDSLPQINEIAKILETEGIKIYEMVQHYYAMSGSSNVVFEVKLDSPAAREREKHTVGFKQEVTV